MTNSLKSALKTLGLIGILVLETGCGFKDRHYEFNGWIDGEQIQFTRGEGSNTLKIKGYDYEVRYDDMFCDGKVDYVHVKSIGSSQIYADDLIGREIIQKAQEKYTNYLAKILAEKRAVGERVILGGKK